MSDIVMLAAGLAGLYLGGEWLLRGALSLARIWRLPTVVAGMVLVGLGTSAPELAVSVDAALFGHGDMAVGNVVGSNIVNFALVLGIAAAASRIPTTTGTGATDVGVLVLLTAATIVFLLDHTVDRIEGAVLLAVVTVTFWYAIHRAQRDSKAYRAEEGSESGSGEGSASGSGQGAVAQLGWLAGGVVVLLVGADLTVTAGISMARNFGVSEALIALTVTAVGTGLPEIAATVVALVRKQHALALGNVIGSNLANLGLVLGVAALVRPLEAPGIAAEPLVVLGILTAVVCGIVIACRFVRRWMGFALLASFGTYQAVLFT